MAVQAKTCAMTWTDTTGITHDVVPLEGGLKPGTCSRRWNVLLRCERFGPIGAKASEKESDCMACIASRVL